MLSVRPALLAGRSRAPAVDLERTIEQGQRCWQLAQGTSQRRLDLQHSGLVEQTRIGLGAGAPKCRGALEQRVVRGFPPMGRTTPWRQREHETLRSRAPASSAPGGPR
jgi:hypothetical protein